MLANVNDLEPWREPRSENPLTVPLARDLAWLGSNFKKAYVQKGNKTDTGSEKLLFRPKKPVEARHTYH